MSLGEGFFDRLNLFAVATLQVIELLGEGVHEVAISGARGLRGGGWPRGSPQMLDALAEIGMAIEEGVGDASLVPDVQEVDGPVRLAEPADGGFRCLGLLCTPLAGRGSQPGDAWIVRHDRNFPRRGLWRRTAVSVMPA